MNTLGENVNLTDVSLEERINGKDYSSPAENSPG